MPVSPSSSPIAATMKSVLRVGHDLRPALAEPLAEQPAGAHPEQPLHELVAVAVDVARRERVQPDVDPLLHVAEHRPGEERAGGEQHDADEQPGQPLGRDVEHRDEDAEEQQRRAEVAFEDEDTEARDPGDDHRAEVAAARQVDAGNPPARQGEHVALDHQVAREEDQQQDLRQLARLEREAGEPDPDPGAVDGAADERQQRQQEQSEAGQHGGVGEALQDPVVTDEQQHGDEQDHADGGPGQLRGCRW